MTDTLIALLPQYGFAILALIVCLSAMAVPLPASILVMTAGGFSAAGDLELWQVVAGAFGGFAIGDQAAYRLARMRGDWALGKLKAKPGRAKLVGRAEAFVKKRGAIAVFLSRTVLSPLGPYVSYISGAVGLHWVKYTVAGVLGAGVWSAVYGYLGYVFAGQITQIAALMSNALGFVAAGGVLVISGIWLFRGVSKAETGADMSG